MLNSFPFAVGWLTYIYISIQSGIVDCMRGGLLKVSIFLAGVLAVLAVTDPVARAAPPDKIVFAWPGPMSSGLGPFIFADELGFFKDENLTLDVISLDGSGTIIPQLMNGSIFSSYITLDPLIVSRQPDKPNFAFRFVYNAVRNSIWEISVLDESPIRSIEDLS